MRITDEDKMSGQVEKFLKKEGCGFVTRKLTVKGGEFDVVGYSEKENVFKVVECKLGTSIVKYGHAFGQILTYKCLLSEKGPKFIDNFVERIAKREPKQSAQLRRALSDSRMKEVRFRFYIALLKEAKKEHDILKLLRNSMKDKIGIILVSRSSGRCRPYKFNHNNKEDLSFYESKPIRIRVIQTSPFVDVDKYDNGTSTLRKLADALDKKVMSINKAIKRRPRADGIVYFFGTNFAHVRPKKKFLTIHLHVDGSLKDPKKWIKQKLSRKKEWVRIKVKTSSNIRYAIKLLRQATLSAKRTRIRLKENPNIKGYLIGLKKVKIGKKLHGSPSGAAKDLLGYSVDGWHHWKYKDRKTGKWQLIDKLRQK